MDYWASFFSQAQAAARVSSVVRCAFQPSSFSARVGSTLLAMLPIVILYLFAQKYIVQGMVDGSIK